MEQLLQPAINVGLEESAFWEMTKAEIERYMEGAVWRLKSKAQFDYSLANLIGLSVGRLFGDNGSYPKIQEVYPELFEDDLPEAKEQTEEEIKVTNSVNNFLAFAMAHNAKVKEGVEQLNDDN